MEKFREFPGVNFNFSQLIRDNVEEALSGVKGANSVKLFGTDLKMLEEAGQRVVERPEKVRGIENVGLFHIVGQPNLEIEIDRRECARYGINVADVETAVQVAIGGQAFSQMVEGEKLYDIVLRLPMELRDDPDVISRIPSTPPAPGRPARRPHPARRSSPRSTRTSRAPPTSTARTTGGSSRSSSASGTATWPRPSPRPSRRSRTRRPAASCPRATTIEWSGEFAQMQEANARLMWIVPAVDRPDHAAALHGVQLAQGRPPGHGQRGRRDDGGRLGAAADRDPVQHLGGRRLHLDLRRRRAGRRAPDLVLQPDARPRASPSARR